MESASLQTLFVWQQLLVNFFATVNFPLLQLMAILKMDACVSINNNYCKEQAKKSLIISNRPVLGHAYLQDALINKKVNIKNIMENINIRFNKI